MLGAFLESCASLFAAAWYRTPFVWYHGRRVAAGLLVLFFIELVSYGQGITQISDRELERLERVQEQLGNLIRSNQEADLDFRTQVQIDKIQIAHHMEAVEARVAVIEDGFAKMTESLKFEARLATYSAWGLGVILILLGWAKRIWQVLSWIGSLVNKIKQMGAILLVWLRWPH